MIEASVLPSRMMAKIQVAAEPCWIWIGQHNEKGYAVGHLDGRMQRVHRVVYERVNCSIPGGYLVDHICFNKGCVNPAHLRLVNTKENGEHRRGAQSNSSSAVRGVYWHKATGKWAARVCHNGRGIHVGLYASVADAEVAVKAARARLFTHDDVTKEQP